MVTVPGSPAISAAISAAQRASEQKREQTRERVPLATPAVQQAVQAARVVSTRSSSGSSRRRRVPAATPAVQAAVNVAKDVSTQKASIQEKKIAAAAPASAAGVGALRGQQKVKEEKSVFERNLQFTTKRIGDIAESTTGLSIEELNFLPQRVLLTTAFDTSRGIKKIPSLFQAPSEERIEAVQRREERFQDQGIFGRITQTQARAFDKALLQTQARIFGTPEQKEEAKFFQRSEQSDALFSAISPFAPPRDPETGRLTQVSNVFDLEFNPEGAINVGVALASAGLTAAPKLFRPSDPFRNIKGGIKIDTVQGTQTGTIPSSQTTLQFTTRSPTLTGFFGRTADVTVKTTVTKEGARSLIRETVVGGKKFLFTQSDDLSKAVLQTFKDGTLASTRTVPKLDVSTLTGVSTAATSEISKPVVSVSDDLITSLQTAVGRTQVSLPVSRANVFSGDVKFSTVLKTEFTPSTAKAITTQTTRGTGELFRQPLLQTLGLDKLFSSKAAQVSIGAPTEIFNFAGTQPQGGAQTSFNFPSIPRPTTPTITFPTQTPSSFGVVPPFIAPPPGRAGSRQQPTTGPIDRLDFSPDIFANPLFRPDLQSKVQPALDPAFEPALEPLIEPTPEPVVNTFGDFISGSFTGPDTGIQEAFENIGSAAFTPQLPQTAAPTPLVPIPFLPLPGFGGGSGVAARPRGRKLKTKKRPTQTLFQSIFPNVNLGEITAQQAGVSEATGLLLRGVSNSRPQRSKRRRSR